MFTSLVNREFAEDLPQKTRPWDDAYPDIYKHPLIVAIIPLCFRSPTAIRRILHPSVGLKKFLPPTFSKFANMACCPATSMVLVCQHWHGCIPQELHLTIHVYPFEYYYYCHKITPSPLILVGLPSPCLRLPSFWAFAACAAAKGAKSGEG